MGKTGLYLVSIYYKTNTGVLRTLLYLSFQVVIRHQHHKILWFLPWRYPGIHWLLQISSWKAAKNIRKKTTFISFVIKYSLPFEHYPIVTSCIWVTSIILPCWWDRFSSYAMVCPLSSCMLSNSEHNNELYGWQLHVMLIVWD